jgi:hypothetical protein
MGADPMAENATFRNPFSWNTNANLFFLDQPVGVGYSYADYGEKISTTPAAAKNIAAFLTIFFETFKQFKGRAFHMAGESYGVGFIHVPSPCNPPAEIAHNSIGQIYSSKLNNLLMTSTYFIYLHVLGVRERSRGSERAG